VRRRWLIAGAGALVLLLAGAAAAFYFYERHQSRDIRGSSTVEFVPTEPAPRPIPKPRPKPGLHVSPALTRVDWPTFGYDGRRLRYLPSPLRPPFRVEWTFRAHHLLEFPPAVAYGRVYVANNPGTLFAISAKTGRLGWRFASGRCTAAAPAVASGLVYEAFLNKPPCNRKPGAPGIDGEIVALEARRGMVRWRHRIGPSESSPLVADGRVYVGDWNGWVYALDAKSGREVWRFRTRGEVKGALALSGRRLYIGSYDHHLYALSARTGRLLWSGSAQERFGGLGTFYSTPAAAYGRVYIGSTDGKVYSFGATTGELRWSQSTGGYVYGSPAVWQRRILIGSYSGRFYSLDAATGDVQWEFRANGPISGSATVLGNVVYFSTLKGRTYGLDPRTGRELWSFPDGKYSPLVAGPQRAYLAGYTKLYGLVPS
jgi:outer membrane protein assembly factor BamB